MDPLQFAYWLQGFAELNNGVPPNDAQWKSIRDHLSLVFNKVTSNYHSIETDWKPAPPPVYTKPLPNTLNPPWTITCASGITANIKSTAIC